jgi:hypothetical protein
MRFFLRKLDRLVVLLSRIYADQFTLIWRWLSCFCSSLRCIGFNSTVFRQIMFFLSRATVFRPRIHGKKDFFVSASLITHHAATSYFIFRTRRTRIDSIDTRTFFSQPATDRRQVVRQWTSLPGTPPSWIYRPARLRSALHIRSTTWSGLIFFIPLLRVKSLQMHRRNVLAR